MRNLEIVVTAPNSVMRNLEIIPGLIIVSCEISKLL